MTISSDIRSNANIDLSSRGEFLIAQSEIDLKPAIFGIGDAIGVLWSAGHEAVRQINTGQRPSPTITHDYEPETLGGYKLPQNQAPQTTQHKLQNNFSAHQIYVMPNDQTIKRSDILTPPMSRHHFGQYAMKIDLSGINHLSLQEEVNKAIEKMYLDAIRGEGGELTQERQDQIKIDTIHDILNALSLNDLPVLDHDVLYPEDQLALIHQCLKTGKINQAIKELLNTVESYSLIPSTELLQEELDENNLDIDMALRQYGYSHFEF